MAGTPDIRDVLDRFVGHSATPHLLEEVRQTVITYAMASALGPSLLPDRIQFRIVQPSRGPAWTQRSPYLPALVPANTYTEALLMQLTPTIITCLGHGGAFAAADVGHTAYLVDFAEQRILVDCGSTVPDVLKEFDIDPGSLTAILITHLHADHCGGLERILYHRHYVSKAQPIPLVMGDGTAESWLTCVRATRNDLERHVMLRSASPSTYLLGGSVQVSARQVSHGGDVADMACYAFLVETGASALFFSGDRIWRHDGASDLRSDMGFADIVFHELELLSPPSGAHTNVADVSDYRRARNIWWGHHGSSSRTAEAAPLLKLTRKGDKWRVQGREVEHIPFGNGTANV